MRAYAVGPVQLEHGGHHVTSVMEAGLGRSGLVDCGDDWAARITRIYGKETNLMGSSTCAICTHTERTLKRLSVIVRIVRCLDDGLPKSKRRMAPADLCATGNHCWDWDLLECFGDLDVSPETNFKLTHYPISLNSASTGWQRHAPLAPMGSANEGFARSFTQFSRSIGPCDPKQKTKPIRS